MTFGSLFAGIGGMDLGLERAGMECRWQVEIDPFARKVLAKHWPNVKRYEDVRTVDWREVERVDLIAGGFPCQPFSSSSRGRKRGMADDRWLWPAMCAAIQALHPAWVLGENVTQLDGPALEQVVSDLEAIGYEVAPPLEVPACAFGFDHWRARLWILGHADRNREPGRPVYAEASVLPRDSSHAGDVGEADGLPSRMDRLAGLGNAVVPAIPEWIGRHILSEEWQKFWAH